MQLINPDFIIESEKRFNETLDPQIINETLNKATIDESSPPSNPNPLDFESEERKAERFDHLKNTVKEPIELAQERIMGKSDLMSINYLQLGFLAAFSVCRVIVKKSNGGTAGYGTGFMISPSLFMTNNHVISAEDLAVNSIVEFNYQFDEFGEPAQSFLFRLRPVDFFKTNSVLDYTIVAVNPVSTKNNKKLKDFGYLKLFEEPGKALITEHLSIIQHPNGDYKQIAIRENRLVEVKGDFVTYVTDTAPGSSGSCVLNDQWQVVALHHSGVPRKDGQGRWLKKDGTVWKNGEDDSLIDWISNEGVRISSIVADLRSTHGNQPLFKEMISAPVIMPPPQQTEGFDTDADEPETKETPDTKNAAHDEQPKTENREDKKDMSNENEQNSIKVTIPIEVTIKVGNAIGTAAFGKPAPAPDNKPDLKETDFIVQESVAPDYKGRNGYQSSFVKKNDFEIKLEDLLEGQTSKLAPLKNPSGNNKYELKYFNFSVVLNKFRRLCVLTAVNIDGNKSQALGRENNPWILDPRVEEKYQTGPTVYKNNDLDRGHMVRRLDPVWGPNAEAANDDTFHFTNSAPQHKDLNQKTWLSLEEHILSNADKENFKVSVFTGPIFSEEDIPYRGILLPLRFYKVAAMIKKDGKPSVTGYMLSQPDEIEDFIDKEGIKDTGFGKFKTYQVPISRIALLTGVNFDRYREFDPLGNVDPNESVDRIEIEKAEDIKI